MTLLSLNHLVLKVRDLERSITFYERTLGFIFVTRERGTMAFLRFPGSQNHHDLGLLATDLSAPDAPESAPGLLHVASQVPRITDLARFAQELTASDALSGASDHGATKSIYGTDPDGNEFEIMWLVPSDMWGAFANRAPTMPLNLVAEIKRWAATDELEQVSQVETDV